MGFALGNRITKEHPHGFRSAIVEGRQGIGKSAYCIKVMKQVYQTLYDCDDKTAYRYALQHLMFSMDDIILYLAKAKEKDEMIPCLTWDDAGVHGSNIKWFKDKNDVDLIKALLETIRTRCSGLLINCTGREGLLTVIRNQRGYIVEISKAREGRYNRIAKGYNMFRLPSGMKRAYKNFEDHYSCYLPNWVYKEYMVIRRRYSDEAVEVMLEEYKLKQRMYKGKKVVA